jgi:acyl-coenzyme A synthetase/AMP-(fatty) acid ligase
MAVPDGLGVDRLVICAVVLPELERRELVPAIRKLFPPFITEGARVFFVESLPRTANGKLQRAAMKARLPQLTGGHAL